MVAVADTRAWMIDLRSDCDRDHCLEMSRDLQKQLSNGYTRNASVMHLDRSFNGYLEAHRTARKRAGRAARLGYRFDYIDRQALEDDINEINASMPHRQGRPMSEGYRQPHRFSPNPVRCARHHVYTYGVLLEDKLVAYLWLYRAGELAMVSSILGHGDHLERDVMYLLVTEAIRVQAPLGGTMFYNLHSSGTEGLRFFKERLGFHASGVEWLL